MLIGQRLREIRESKDLSQGDIEARTGLLRCYTSRVECGHTVPSVETLEKYARALEVPLYQLFHDGESPIEKPKIPAVGKDTALRGALRKDWRELRLFAKALSRMDDHDRKLLFFVASAMARREKRD